MFDTCPWFSHSAPRGSPYRLPTFQRKEKTHVKDISEECLVGVCFWTLRLKHPGLCGAVKIRGSPAVRRHLLDSQRRCERILETHEKVWRKSFSPRPTRQERFQNEDRGSASICVTEQTGYLAGDSNLLNGNKGFHHCSSSGVRWT